VAAVTYQAAAVTYQGSPAFYIEGTPQMALIASNSLNVVAPVTIVKTTLSAADTLSYSPSKLQTLFLRNTTASPVTVTIDGDGATNFAPGGIGKTIDLSAGLAVVVPASGLVAVQLRQIARYLSGTVAVTGGVGVDAWVTE
jgi:hypothetical protein